MKVTQEQIRDYVIDGFLSYQKTADILGVSKSAVARAARKYTEEHNVFEPQTIDDPRVQELEAELALEKQKVEDLRRGLGRNVSIRTTGPDFKVALISDTHYGSLYHDKDALTAFLDHAANRGVQHIIHAGDVLEGEKMHFGQDRELSHAGFAKQLDALVSQYPRSYIPVSFITGNHDRSYYKQSGIDVGGEIAKTMGWENLGDCFGEVKYQTPNGDYRITAVHPGGGSAYSLSYKMQKMIEQWEGGKKPNCIVAGHFHKAMWLPSYRNVSGFHPGCFQKQTPFMASKSLAAHVAGVILDVTVGGEWNSVTAEFMTFY